MNVYVDNVIGVDDASHGASVNTPIKTLSYIFSVPGFANDSTVYIKATGVEYQDAVNERLLDFYSLGYSGITLDRYPTDTGTSRPILSHTSNYAASRALIRLDGSDFTIKNLYFKGKTVQNEGGVDSIINIIRAAERLIIQDSVFDLQYTMKGITYYTFSSEGLTIRRCHFSVLDAVKDITGVARVVIGPSGGGGTCYGMTFENNIVENFTFPLPLTTRSAGTTLIIDHNTFYECARTVNGKLAYVGMSDVTTPATFTNNIIYNSSAEGSSWGFYGTGNISTLTAGHNTWHGINTHYYNGSTPPDPESDLDIVPIWQGGSKEWEAAHIQLANYLAPISTQTDLVFGDDSASTIGAIVVTYATTLDTAYVDNTVSASGDGTTDATALKTINEAVLAINDNGTIYIKATDIDYTGENDNNNIYIINKDNVTIDIYDNLANRGDKPVINYVDDKDVGCIFKFINCSNVIIQNLYFKGVTDPTKTTSIIDFVSLSSSNVSFNKCVFEGKQAKKIFSFEKEVTGISLTYCYMDTARTDIDSVDTNCVDASNSDGYLSQLTFQHNIVKNFTRALYLLYHGTGDNEIDHNTFIDAGVGGSNACINLGTVNVLTSYQMNSNILIGSGDGTGVGITWTNGGGEIEFDYSDLFDFNSLYGGDAVAGSNDLNVDPSWPGYEALWYYADIYLSNFYYPTNELVLNGGLSVMGAVTLPPAAASTEISGIQQSDGTPYFCIDNDLFNRLKTHLIDANIYDTSANAIGLSDSRISITGNANFNPGITITLYKYYKGESYTVDTTLTDAYGNWSISDRLSHGRSSYYAVGEGYRTSSYHMNAYNIHVWLCAYATEFNRVKNETSQIRQNGYISDGVDFDGDSISTNGYYLTRNFGQFISARKLETMTEDEYRTLLVDVLNAYNLGPAEQSFDIICKAFTGRIPTTEYYNKTLCAFPDPDVTTRLRVLGAPSLNYEWDETEVYLYDRRWVIKSGNDAIAVDSMIWVYVDGTSPVGVNNSLSIQTSVSRPYRYEATFEETIDSGLIHVDTDGTETGIIGELYVTTSRLPLELNGVSGTIFPFIGGIDNANIVLNTSNIDLGVAQDNIDKTVVYGDITVSYQTNYEFIVLGRIESGPSGITDITESDWIDGGGAVYRDAEVAGHCGEIRIYDSQLLSTEARADLFQTLKDIKAAYKFFHVFMENEISGELEYYDTI